MPLRLGSTPVTVKLGSAAASVYAGANSASAAVPGVPTGVTGGKEVMSWSPPESDGGSAITEYRVYDAEGKPAEPPAYTTSETSLTGVAPGSYQVSAVNAVGEGDRSSSVSVFF